MHTRLLRYNLRTGDSVRIGDDTAYFVECFTTRQGQLRAALGVLDQDWFLSVPKSPGHSARRIELGARYPPDFSPHLLAADPRTIVGIQYGADDTESVVAWDLVTDAKKTLWHLPGFASHSIQLDPADPFRIIGVAYETDRPQKHFFAPEDQRLAASIDAALPGTDNNIVSANADRSRLIISRTGERLYEDFYYLDRATMRLNKLGSAMPHLEPDRLASSRFFTCRTRDGWPLHGRIYLPR